MAGRVHHVQGEELSLEVQFGSRIRRLRIAKEIGLREFARRVGISSAYLSRIESSATRPPVEDVIHAMAMILGCDEDELMSISGRVSYAALAVIHADPKMQDYLRLIGERRLLAKDLIPLLPTRRKGKNQ